MHTATLARLTAKTDAVQGTHEYVVTEPATEVLTADELPQSQVLLAEFQLRGEGQRQEFIWSFPVERTVALQTVQM